jgi:hypothetical protein
MLPEVQEERSEVGARIQHHQQHEVDGDGEDHGIPPLVLEDRRTERAELGPGSQDVATKQNPGNEGRKVLPIEPVRPSAVEQHPIPTERNGSTHAVEAVEGRNKVTNRRQCGSQ